MAWIFGSSRSGSSWLTRMLGELGAVTIDDPHLGHHLGVWRPVALAWATAEGSAPPLTTLNRIKREKQSYFFSERYREAWQPALRQLIVTRFEAEVDEAVDAGADPASPVVIKEPGSHVADELLRLFPGSGMVFLLRDGRDVVDSWLAAYRPGSWAQSEGAYPLSAAGRLAMIRWQAAVWSFRTEVVSEAYERHEGAKVIVRYEELLADPAAELGRIAAALGFDASSADVERVAGRHRFDAVPENERGPLHAVRAGVSGGWRENLDAAEQQALIEALQPMLSRLGFEDEDEGEEYPEPLSTAG